MSISEVELINSANLITITGYLGDMYALLITPLTANTTGVGDRADAIKEILLNHGSDEELYEVLTDLLTPVNNFVVNIDAANDSDNVMKLIFQTFIQALDAHCSLRGSNVHSSIVSLDTYASYGATFDYSADFAALYLAVTGTALTAGNIGA